jgi:hypothetical protein
MDGTEVAWYSPRTSLDTVGASNGGKTRVSMSLACDLDLWGGRLMVRPSLVLGLVVE